jgi:hypothetical protein
MKPNFVFWGILTLLISSIVACKKEPGVGGNSSITGKVTTNKYTPTFNVLITTYPGANEDVFIQYGDANGISDKVSADYNGEFVFEYLYPGNYKIWVYSKDSASTTNSGQLTVLKNVTIKKKERANIGNFSIADN